MFMQVKPGMMKKIVPLLERHGYQFTEPGPGVYDFHTEYRNRFIEFDEGLGSRYPYLRANFMVHRPNIYLELERLSGLCQFRHADYRTQAELDAYLDEIALALEEKILPHLDALTIGLSAIQETNQWLFYHDLADHTEARAAAFAHEHLIPLEPTQRVQEMLEAELLLLCPSNPALRGAAFLHEWDALLGITALFGELKRQVLNEIPIRRNTHWDWHLQEDDDLPDWYPRVPAYILISRETGARIDPLEQILRYWFYAQETNAPLPLMNPGY